MSLKYNNSHRSLTCRLRRRQKGAKEGFFRFLSVPCEKSPPKEFRRGRRSQNFRHEELRDPKVMESNPVPPPAAHPAAPPAPGAGCSKRRTNAKKIIVCLQHGLRLLPHPALHRQHQDHKPQVPRVREADREVEGGGERRPATEEREEKHGGVIEIMYNFDFIRATLRNYTYTILQRSRPQLLQIKTLHENVTEIKMFQRLRRVPSKLLVLWLLQIIARGTLYTLTHRFPP